MLLRRRQGSTFYCFSPPVMLVTFAVEIILVGYTLWRYRISPLVRLVCATLLALAIFQLSEYFVCGGAGVDAMWWSRVGFVAITLLPPLGLHILHVISGRKQRHLVWAAYATAIAFGTYFLFANQAFSGNECTGNYVIFQITPVATLLYSLYYYGWLGTAVYLGLRWRSQTRKQLLRRGIAGLLVGYAVFLVPTSIAVVFNPEALAGIPSIMCGFAGIFAIILVGYLLPTMRSKRR
jgi:hypothetical protein